MWTNTHTQGGVSVFTEYCMQMQTKVPICVILVGIHTHTHTQTYIAFVTLFLCTCVIWCCDILQSTFLITVKIMSLAVLWVIVKYELWYKYLQLMAKIQDSRKTNVFILYRSGHSLKLHQSPSSSEAEHHQAESSSAAWMDPVWLFPWADMRPVSCNDN